MAERDKDNAHMLKEDMELARFSAHGVSATMPDYGRDVHGSITNQYRHLTPGQSSECTTTCCISRRKTMAKRCVTFQEKRGDNSDTITLEISGSEGQVEHRTSKNEHFLRSGSLAQCDDPDCIDCPSDYKTKEHFHGDMVAHPKELHTNFHNGMDGQENKVKKCVNHIPIINPHSLFAQIFNQIFVLACLAAIFIDPLFLYVMSVDRIDKCIVFNLKFAIALAVIRSFTDFIYLINMLIQFRLAYVAPESRVVGAGDIVDDPKKIAMRYLRGSFLIDLFVVLPLPQVIILLVIPEYVGNSSANYAKNMIRAAFLVQYIPRMYRLVSLLASKSAKGFIFESAWASFAINLLMFALAGHVVGAWWYLLGLQRVNQCLQDACGTANFDNCRSLVDCGYGFIRNQLNRQQWLNDSNSESCFSTSGDFQFGIYQQAVLLTTKPNIIIKYIYASFWGFQQISTLAGNLVPSYFEWEVLFTMAIIGLGLLLFALLIGNMQNFLQSLGRRKLEMQLRRHDVEQWMNHRRLPDKLKRKIRAAESFSWAVTRGVDEDELLANLPEDIQREIRRHFLEFLKKVRLFNTLDEPVLDAITDKLKQKFYIKESSILKRSGVIEKMYFIVRGKLESTSADGSIDTLQEGDICGEELLIWYLENISDPKEGKKGKKHGLRPRVFSTRTVKCITNVEAFALEADDMEEVSSLFPRALRSVQLGVRSQSLYSRNFAATSIQVAWRYHRHRSKLKDQQSTPLWPELSKAYSTV